MKFPILPRDITAGEFAAELEHHGFRVSETRIVSDQCPGIAWTPVMKRGHIARRKTLAKVLRERAAEIAKREGRP
jgi:hypothetical protein